MSTRSATGAAASGSTLYIATVKPDHDGRMRLVKSRSGEIELHEREQTSLRMFTTFLLEFVEAKDIRELTLVNSPVAGSHMANADVYKIEAIVQLLPAVVTLLAASGLPSLKTRLGTGIPGADRERLGARAANAQMRAILAAMYEYRAAKDRTEPVALPTRRSSRGDVPKRPLTPTELIESLYK